MTADATGEEEPVARPAADDDDRTGTGPALWSTGERPLVNLSDTGPQPQIRPYLTRSLPVPPGTDPPPPALPKRGRGFGGLAVPRRRRSDDEPPAHPSPTAPPESMGIPGEAIAPPSPTNQRAAGWAGPARGHDEEQPEVAAVPRPFVLTAGRVAAEVPYIGLETQVTATSGGPPPADLAPQLTAIVTLCAEPTSVAEISARLRLHLGVARILVADLHTAGLLDVPGVDAGMATDPDLIMRVMRGIRDLS